MVKKIILITIGFMLSSLVLASEFLIQPLSEPMTKKQLKTTPNHTTQAPAFLISEGDVMLNVPQVYLNTPFTLRFPDGSQRQVKFTKRKDDSGSIALWGRTGESQAINTTMTIGKKNFFLTINDFKHSETFNIVGNIANGKGKYKRFNNRSYRQHIKHATPPNIENKKRFDYRAKSAQ